MLRRKVKCPCSEHQGRSNLGSAQLSRSPPATSFLLAPSPPHHRFLPLLCYHQPQDRKPWLAHARPRSVRSNISLRFQGSSLDLLGVSWLWWGEGLEKAPAGLTLGHCPLSTWCSLAMDASKWGLGNWIIAQYHHMRKYHPPKFISQ